MYVDLPQRLRELIDDLVEVEVRLRELERSNGSRARKKLTDERRDICRMAFAYCKSRKLGRRIVNAAFFERLGRKVTDDSIV